MKKKMFTRPVSVILSDEMFEQIKTITDHGEIGLSDYIREAIQKKLEKDNHKQTE
jgi:metal-responsive CopG/Arc/MetJ family transcriptional regulator